MTEVDPVADPAPAADPSAGLDRTRATIAAGPLLAPVLARLAGIHASRAGLTVDRLADTILITDAVAAQAAAILGTERVPVSMQSESGRLELRVGPLDAGDGRRLLEATHLPETGAVVELLADEVRLRSGAGGGETLVLRVGQRRPS